MADELGLAGDGCGGDEALVTQVVGGVDGLFVQLGQQNVGDGPDNGLRRALQQIGEVDENLTLAQADGGIERGETAETHNDGRDGRPGTQGPVLFLEDS